jgi:hypothetical protein
VAASAPLSFSTETELPKKATMNLPDIFKLAKGIVSSGKADTSQPSGEWLDITALAQNAANGTQTPRWHHYNFAYKALPGAAFSDPYMPLGLGQDEPKGALKRFWAEVGERFPKDERVSDRGLAASAGKLGQSHCFVLVTMPEPERDTEAYFIAIVYPRDWIEDPDAYHNSTPDVRCYLLAKSAIPAAGETHEGTFRTVTRDWHGAVKFGVAVSKESFLSEIQEALGKPLQCITLTQSPTWSYFIQDRVTMEPCNDRGEHVEQAPLVSPNLLAEAVDKGVWLLELGVNDRWIWSRTMVYSLGEQIRPDLDRIWDSAQAALQKQQTAKMGPPTSEQSTAREAPVLKRRNYLVRHWRGELSLGFSYWVNGFLVYVILTGLTGVVCANSLDVGLKTTALAGVFLYLLAIAATVWQMVGIWRSANAHVGRGGKHGWVIVAKIAVVLGVIRLLFMTGNTLVPQSVEFARIVLGDRGIPAYEIRVLPGGEEIEFRGGIRAGSAKELARILEAVPQAKVLHLNSIGGRVQEAGEMAQLVRAHGLTTYTSEECDSAATLVFLSGKERVVEANARIGFHRWNLPGMTEEQKKDSQASLRQIMRSAGVSEAFISRVLATSPDDMWFPSVQQMRAAGVITGESHGERFAVSGALLRSSSPDMIAAVWSNLPGFRAVKELEPATYQKMVKEFSAAVKSGKSLGEAEAASRRTLEGLTLRYLPLASDEALMAMRDTWVKMLMEYKDQDSRACIAMITGNPSGPQYDYSTVFPAWNCTNELIVLEDVLRSAASGRHRQTDVATAERDLKGIRAALSRRFGDEMSLLTQEDRWAESPDRVCTMLLAFYEATQRTPRERQGNLLRYILSDPSGSEGNSVAAKRGIDFIPDQPDEFTPSDFERAQKRLPNSPRLPLTEEQQVALQHKMAEATAGPSRIQAPAPMPDVASIYRTAYAHLPADQATKVAEAAIRYQSLQGYQRDIANGMDPARAQARWAPMLSYGKQQ